MKWKATNTSYGTMYHSFGQDEGWQISTPRPAAEGGMVELKYGRREEGAIVPIMLEVGRFASAAEAMLAARMFAAGDVHPESAVARQQMGFTPYFEGAEKLDIGNGRKHEYFLFLTGVGRDKRETGLVYEGPGKKNDDHNIGRIWSSTMKDTALVPAATAEGAHDIEVSILMELLRIRRERGPGRYAEPMVLEEFFAWEAGRYEPAVDPDGHRPYSRATAEIRNAAARDLLIGNREMQERLGISPGYEERVADKQTDFDGFLDNLIMARARGDMREEILDMLDTRTLELEGTVPNGP